MLSLYYLMKQPKKEAKYDITGYYSKILARSSVKIKNNLSLRCRVCLQEGCILIQGYENTDIQGILKFFDIHLHEDDSQPKYLCDTCHEFIQSAILFRRVAKHTDKILNQSIKVEPVPESYDQGFSDNEPCDTTLADDKWNETEGSIKEEKKIKIKYTPKATCNICNKVINRSYYKEHMTMHDPDHKKYVCDVCGKSFRLRCAYYNHSLRHRNDFPFRCQFCPYKGRYAELLKTHMRTHTGDYRYMCTECPARFLFKSNLNSHMLKHKEPQFKCEACKRAFHTKLSLQRHFEADHLGIKNHVCNVCGKAFGYRNAMMKHQRHVHKREKLLFGRMPAYLEAEHSVPDC